MLKSSPARRNLGAGRAAVALGLLAVLSCGGDTTEPDPVRPPPTRPAPPAAVAVTPQAIEFTALRDTARLLAEVRDANGRVVAGAVVAWASSDTAVATIAASGLAVAAGNGSATLTASAGAASGSAAVTVAQRIAAVVVSPAADTLVKGETLRLSGEAQDANGYAVAGTTLAWASSDTTVAVVDGAGAVTGLAAGRADITAAAAGLMGSAELTVLRPAPAIVLVTPGEAELTALGDTIRLSAEVLDQIGRPLVDVDVSWTSGDSAVVSVDSTGLVRATGPGTAAVAAAAGAVSGEARLSVMQAAFSVTVSPPSRSVAPGDTARLIASATDANGHPLRGVVFDWSSSDVTIASVDGSGLVRGVSEGSATITAEAGEASGASEITVASPDRAVLGVLYEVMGGTAWRNSDNWLTDLPLGEWYGVEVDSHGRVTHLSLDDNGLTGAIPAETARLSQLRQLRLSRNGLEGSIPPELGSLAELTLLQLPYNGLTGSIPPELGSLKSLTGLLLQSTNLSGPIPPELGQLSRLTRLWLFSNSLTGSIPPALGGLASLTSLRVSGNNLTGSMPPELASLGALTQLRFEENAGLCAPGTVEFVTWLRAVSHTGPFCNEADMATLRALYDAANGANWADSEGWLDGPALGEWHGVDADSTGRVLRLDLAENGLVGSLPPMLGTLVRLTTLRIGGNALSGRPPLGLAGLSLREFHYADTELCAPAGASFQAWLNAVPSLEATGLECTALSDREILEIVYEAMHGAGWRRSGNWLTDAPLEEWYGVEVNERGRVSGLTLGYNDLAGPISPEIGELTDLVTLNLGGNWLPGRIPSALGKLVNLTRLRLSQNSLAGLIPPELGELAKLRQLWLFDNNLTGAIPPELGNMTELSVLSIANNRLTGSIPPELGLLSNLSTLGLSSNGLDGTIPRALGDLVSLSSLNLFNNRLTGAIPADLGRLSVLKRLQLSGNELDGPIPAELGDLTRVETLQLSHNALTGDVPPELGRLVRLENLDLGHNALTGPIPSEWGGMTALETLVLTNNPAMGGTVPTTLTALDRLAALLAGQTGLCAPVEGAIRDWLVTVRTQRISGCADGAGANAYLTQTVQSRRFPVPLVAGEEALLRVFVASEHATGEHTPAIRARFFVDGTQTHVMDVPGKPMPIPTAVDEGDLSKSANAGVPGAVVQPGLQIVIEIDPDATLDPALGIPRRIPDTGRLPVDVRAMPVLDITAVPLLWSQRPDSSVVGLVAALAADPRGHELLSGVRTLLPVGELDVTAHEPVVVSNNHFLGLTFDLDAIRVMEGGTGYYVGLIRGLSGAGGSA
ncbi:MAG: hypothetical protein F4164_01690, partial [Gemmatimonadales bacterium]|nr:hypothetical protein [Gemmatimonadales bacterium]